MRAPERRIFKIDVGNIPPDEVDNFMNGIIQQTKKIPFMDQQTGDYNLKFNLMNVLEDFFIPVRGGESGTEIDIAPALNYDAIEDIEYLRNKMMAALRIPKAFLGYEEGIGAKATLAGEDLRFARTIERLQRIVVSELYKMGIIHLYAQGYRDEDLVNFEIQLTSPSIVYEEEKIALWDAKTALAANIRDINLLSADWIYTELFKLTKKEADEQRDNLLKDALFEHRLAKILEDGEDPFGEGWDKMGDPDAEYLTDEDEEEEFEGEEGEESENMQTSETGTGEEGAQPEGQPETQASAPAAGTGGGESAAPSQMAIAGESIKGKKILKSKSKKKIEKDKDDPLGLKDLKKSLELSKSDIKNRHRGGSPLSIEDYRKMDK